MWDWLIGQIHSVGPILHTILQMWPQPQHYAGSGLPPQSQPWHATLGPSAPALSLCVPNWIPTALAPTLCMQDQSCISSPSLRSSPMCIGLGPAVLVPTPCMLVESSYLACGAWKSSSGGMVAALIANTPLTKFPDLWEALRAGSHDSVGWGLSTPVFMGHSLEKIT